MRACGGQICRAVAALAVGGALLFGAPSAEAVPVLQTPFVLHQPDGTSFWARGWGDERASGTSTQTDYTILLDRRGYWVYAELGPADDLVAGPRIVGRHAPPPDAFLLRPGKQAQSPAGQVPAQVTGMGGPLYSPPLNLANHRLLVIVVDFTPSQSLGTGQGDWANWAFNGGAPTAPESVADYWFEASYGQLQLAPVPETFGVTNDGVVFVTLPYAHPNSDGNDATRQATRDAILAANPFVDYSAFDDNGDGWLNTNELHLMVIFRGYETGYGGPGAVCAGRGRVNGHHWSLFGAVPAPVVDGVRVGHPLGSPFPGGPWQGGYINMGEWHCANFDNPGHMATIGVGAHELGHDLGTGMPDLYDTDGSSEGVGDWAVMSSGSWNAAGPFSGQTPSLPCAFSKWFFGFIQPELVTSCSDDHPFPQVATAAGPFYGVVQLRDNPGGVDWEPGGPSGTGQYFLLENRQQVGFDAGLPAEGILIWHIDETVPTDNTANATEGPGPPGSPRLVALEQSDGSFQLECYGGCNSGDAGDPYRGSSDELTESTTPSSDLYSGTASGVSVTDVSPSGANMTADLLCCLVNGSSCDDGDACTQNDTCSGGSCVGGGPVTCNDGNICTTDGCDPLSGCIFTPNTLPCDDGDACTTGDTCAGGTCSGTGTICDDGNPCTDDSCSPGSGCANTPNTAPCDDGDPCTTVDTCSAGSCVGGGPPPSCDDGNLCTNDSCNPGVGCQNLPNTLGCDDGNPCTTGDTCSGGTCSGTGTTCDDGNVCTTDICDIVTGCSHVDNTDPCDDGNACTQNDTCSGGSCSPGGPVGCDDGNVCTDDSCNPGSGCINAPNTAACDDGDACTQNDTCSGGACGPGGPVDCDDGNPCTDDSCDPATGCVNTPNNAACDDGNACTAGDQCAGGSCQSGFTLNCDDGNPCTNDSCDSAGGCVFTPNTGACDDGNACTTGTVCSGGACGGGSAIVCDDGNACTNDSCNAVTGCLFTPNNAPCDDGNACTSGDQCSGGSCQGGVTINCNDGNPCTDDSCNPLGGCQFSNNANPCNDNNACTSGEACSGGSCGGGVVTSCDDGNPCTDDSCSPVTGCTNSNNLRPCDDNDACTLNDQCSGGVCQGGVNVSCNDGNPCTDDSCDPAQGCVYPPNAAPCNDNNACTVADVCAGGTCSGGTPLVCDDGNPCTNDQCSPVTGSIHTNAAAPCDDNDPCTAVDMCSGGTCSGNSYSCDDSDPCTIDSCNGDWTCTNTPDPACGADAGVGMDAGGPTDGGPGSDAGEDAGPGDASMASDAAPGHDGQAAGDAQPPGPDAEVQMDGSVAQNDAGRPPNNVADSGCGCRQDEGGDASLLLGLILLGLFLRRRRRP